MATCSGRDRRRRLTLAIGAALTSLLVPAVGDARADDVYDDIYTVVFPPRTVAVEVLDIPADFAANDATPDGRFVVGGAPNSFAERADPPNLWRLDTVTGGRVPIRTIGQVTDDGREVWGVVDPWAAPRRLAHEIVGGSLRTVPDPVDAATRGDWQLQQVIGIADDQVILRAAGTDSAGRPGAAYFAYAPASGATTVFRSLPADAGGREKFSVSPNGHWATYTSADDDGAYAPLVRRHLPTGRVDVVHAVSTGTTAATVLDNGRVIISAMDPIWAFGTQIGPTLFYWDHPGTDPVPISIGADGSVGTGVFSERPGFLRIVAAGDFVYFASPDERIVPGVDDRIGRQYRAALPPRGSNDAARVAAGDTYCVTPPGATPGEVVAINVTVVEASRRGYGVLHSSERRPEGVSHVNFRPGSVDPNLAFAEVGTDGRVCYTNGSDGAHHVVLDLAAIATADVLRPVDPATDGPRRLLDTRREPPSLAPRATRCGALGAAPEGDLVVVNLTPVGAAGRGWAAVGSGASDRSSAVNFDSSFPAPNAALAPIEDTGPGRVVCIRNGPTRVDMVVDGGLVVAAGSIQPVPTARVIDTRRGLGGARVTPGARRCATVPGAEPGALVFANLTPVDADGRGYLTLAPGAAEPAGTSAANYAPGAPNPNLGIVPAGEDGRICVVNGPGANVDVVVDIQGVGDADTFRTVSAQGAVRITDTRLGRDD